MTEQRTALVTGANKGIGAEIARRLAAAGHIVWVGSRDRDRGQAAVAALVRTGAAAHLLELDVTDDASVLAAARALAQQTDRLDVLVNNAGIAGTLRDPPSQELLDQVKTIYETNVFGVIRVTQAFLPLLKASASARIVMVSSGLGSIGRGLDPASELSARNLLGYSSSKTALNAVTVAFAKELAPLGIKVNAADPGYTATDLNGHMGHRTVEQAAGIAVRLAMLDDDGPTAGFFNDEGPQPW